MAPSSSRAASAADSASVPRAAPGSAGADSTRGASVIETVGAPGDSASPPRAPRRRARTAEADSARARAARRAFAAPGWVMARSALIPGWGQLHNHAWIKAGAIAGAQALLGIRLAGDFRALEPLDREVQAARLSGDADREDSAVLAYNARLDQAVRRQWLIGGVLAYSLLDAYVDAHFRNFDIEFEQDPALPAGGGQRVSARLGLRWTF